MNDIQPFWYLQYLPHWMPATLFNLLLWYFIILVCLDWKSYKTLKFSTFIKWKNKSKNNKITEDDIIYMLALLFYGLCFFIYFNIFYYLFNSAILLLFFCFDLFLDFVDLVIDSISPLGIFKSLKHGAYEIYNYLVDNLILFKNWFFNKINIINK